MADGELFCSECGTKVVFEPEAESISFAAAAANVANETTEYTAPSPCQEEEDDCGVPICVRGFILTNAALLSKRLGVSKEGLVSLLQAYIKGMRQLGVRYLLLDASDYTYAKKPLIGKPKHVSLGEHAAWYEYADILKDQHDAEVRAKADESEYVFIIGGEMDVPMPRLRHFFQNSHDKTFDTDLLYAYPYGKEMEEKLLNQELFKYDALFYVGRLPIAKDGNIDDLTGYLQQVLDNRCAVPQQMAYAQCDPHWQKVTAAITKEIAECGLFPSYTQPIPREVMTPSKIFLTPAVVCDDDDTHPLFNPNATYYFFNMHGGAGKSDYGFYGADMNNRGMYQGMSPTLIQQAQQPNLFFTQACYGGRFVGYRKHESTVLTALAANTLAYVGSSRVAYGAVDSNSQQVALSSSDVLAQVYNHCILAGCTAGASLFQARIATFKRRPGDLVHALTIAEFNLYGEPLVHIAAADKHVAYSGDKHAVLAQDAQVAPLHEEVLMDKSAGAQSLLSQVRQAVDRNIMAISSAIAKSLYAQYGMEAREPLIVSRYAYADGHKELRFVYPPTDAGAMQSEMHVQTNEQGEILQVSATK